MSISVIIPTYNRAHTLTRAINSVLAQSVAPDEILVIDDGSTDKTQDTLRQYKSRIHVITQANRGVSHARNTGINLSASTWVALLDSDDAWQPNKLEVQLEQLTQTHYKLCHTDEIWYRHQRRVNPKQKHTKQGGHIFQQCLPLCTISPSSVMIHREIFNTIGLFDENLPACEDYDLWLRICAQHPVLFVNQPLTLKYGGHSDQLSQKYWGMDRFRIYALNKLIKNETLSTENKRAAIAMLKTKINLYLNGAKKRNKFEEVSYYQELLRVHCESSA